MDQKQVPILWGNVNRRLANILITITKEPVEICLFTINLNYYEYKLLAEKFKTFFCFFLMKVNIFIVLFKIWGSLSRIHQMKSMC